MSDDKITVDEYHRHEVVDRAHTIQLMLHELLDGHPAMTPALNEHFKVAAKAIFDLYQEAASDHLDTSQ